MQKTKYCNNLIHCLSCSLNGNPLLTAFCVFGLLSFSFSCHFPFPVLRCLLVLIRRAAYFKNSYLVKLRMHSL